jgi:hypothetical protein
MRIEKYEFVPASQSGRDASSVPFLKLEIRNLKLETAFRAAFTNHAATTTIVCLDLLAGGHLNYASRSQK